MGTESMSNCPYYIDRGEHTYGDFKLTVCFSKIHFLENSKSFQDGIQRDGISDAILGNPMGVCAEKTVKDYGFTREDQDKYALESYQRAANAWAMKLFEDEVIPVIVKNRNGPDTVIAEDEEYKRLIEAKVTFLIYTNNKIFKK